MSSNRTKYGACLSALVLPLAVEAVALAQQPPAGLRAQAPATGGVTEVAKEGFQAVAAPPAEDANDTSALKLSAGGFLSQGNSRTLAFTSSADYLLRRSASQFGAIAAINYGRSAPGVGEPYETTVENYQARVRYDYFFVTSVAGFISVSGRRDRFQGLDLRLNFDPGLAYYFIDEKGHRFWAELGYDFQYDVRNRGFIDDAQAEAMPPGGLDLPKTEKRHNVRAFVGYDNQLSDAVKFGTGLEYLQNVTEAENARVNYDAALTAQLNQDFSIATTFALKFDNNPLPGVEKTDMIVALNLVYTMN
jgi:putative salt-induced outer membrane protein